MYSETIITAKITRIGSSLCMVIPVSVLRAAELARGDTLCFVMVDHESFGVQKVHKEAILEIKSM